MSVQFLHPIDVHLGITHGLVSTCHDASVFTKLKCDEVFTSNNKNTVVQAASQGVKDVLNETFVFHANDLDAKDTTKMQDERILQ